MHMAYIQHFGRIYAIHFKWCSCQLTYYNHGYYCMITINNAITVATLLLCLLLFLRLRNMKQLHRMT